MKMREAKDQNKKTGYIGILRVIEDYRYPTVNQIRALFDLSSYAEAMRILSSLRKSEHLERLVLTKASNRISYCYVFALSRRGASKLTLMTGHDRCFYIKSKSQRSTFFLEHTILINNFRICLEILSVNKMNFHLLLWKQLKKDVKIKLNNY